VVPALFGIKAFRRFAFRSTVANGDHLSRGPLALGQAGEVHGGDRLPWIANAAGSKDNFAPLTALEWQVHVYGEPSPELSSTCHYCQEFRRRIESLGMKEVISAPQSPWQNAFAERLIGSIRRECLDHVVVLSQRHLRKLLKSYFTYYHRSRTHLALAKDAPESRAIMSRGEIVAIPQVGGLHRRYERRAA
jgi:Integrase core domain